MANVFEHPTLGNLIPKSGKGVNQFLGLKYASLKNRFSPPEPYSSVSSDILDTTQHGPSVISPPIGCELEFGFIQKSLTTPEFKSSELDGLNLNITIPANITRQQKLPVFVFIHGGGFSIGGNSWPQYDMARLVQLSIQQNEPIIGININYRVGVFGFLTSEEMKNAGYLGNNGLRDQRVAFEWIKKNIAGFGGDPDNICVGGESAGGISTTLHLYSKIPQFARAASFGGTCLLMKPLPPFVYEMTYKTVLEKLGITGTSPEERVSALLAIPAEDIFTKLPPGLPLHPVLDGDLVPVEPTFKDIADKQSSTMPGKHWCNSLFIGDNQMDASILISGMEGRDGRLVENFITSLTKSLAPHPGVAESLLKAYDISKSMSDDAALIAILNFSTDIGFFAPTHTFADGWPGDVYFYCFNEPNPWDGRFKGYSSHIIDVAFLFQNYNEFLSPAQAESAMMFAFDIIRFVNGKEPWAAFGSDKEPYRVYGPSEGVDKAVVMELSGKDPAAKRRGEIFRFADRPGLDVISGAFGMFLAGQ